MFGIRRFSCFQGTGVSGINRKYLDPNGFVANIYSLHVSWKVLDNLKGLLRNYGQVNLDGLVVFFEALHCSSYTA